MADFVAHLFKGGSRPDVIDPALVDECNKVVNHTSTQARKFPGNLADLRGGESVSELVHTLLQDRRRGCLRNDVNLDDAAEPRSDAFRHLW